jgi:hypothetical protein
VNDTSKSRYVLGQIEASFATISRTPKLDRLFREIQGKFLDKSSAMDAKGNSDAELEELLEKLRIKMARVNAFSGE